MSGGFNVRAVAAEIVATSQRSARVFPLDVETAALFLPVHVELVKGLTLSKISAWLQSQLEWLEESNLSDRQLRGCLVAHRGRGIIFLEEAESVAERRFTLAHELAHFIGHYLALREAATARLGSSIVPALDGDRLPTAAERLSGVLAKCPIGIFQDVLSRDGVEPTTVVADRMENEADAAAFLALAPPQDVVARCRATQRQIDRNGLLETLLNDFGLAKADALNHVPVVLHFVRKQAPSLVESLKAAAASEKRPGRSI
jgi:hypothetical protein